MGCAWGSRPTTSNRALLPCPAPHRTAPPAGTAQAAELVDLRYAHHASPEAAVALLSLKQLLVQPEGGAADGAAAYQVLSASLVPGRQLEFVVAAPARGGPAAPAGTQGLAVEGMAGVLGGAAPNGSAAAAADAAQGALWLGAAPAELARIVVSNAGVHELRGGAAAGAPAQRRLLTVGLGRGVVRGVAVDTTAGACGEPLLCCFFAARRDAAAIGTTFVARHRSTACHVSGRCRRAWRHRVRQRRQPHWLPPGAHLRRK